VERFPGGYYVWYNGERHCSLDITRLTGYEDYGFVFNKDLQRLEITVPQLDDEYCIHDFYVQHQELVKRKRVTTYDYFDITTGITVNSIMELNNGFNGCGRNHYERYPNIDKSVRLEVHHDDEIYKTETHKFVEPTCTGDLDYDVELFPSPNKLRIELSVDYFRDADNMIKEKYIYEFDILNKKLELKKV